MKLTETTPPPVERTFVVEMNEKEAMALLLVMGNISHQALDDLLYRVTVDHDEKIRLRALLDDVWYEPLHDAFGQPYLSASCSQAEERMLREMGVRL